MEVRWGQIPREMRQTGDPFTPDTVYAPPAPSELAALLIAFGVGNEAALLRLLDIGLGPWPTEFRLPGRALVSPSFSAGRRPDVSLEPAGLVAAHSADRMRDTFRVWQENFETFILQVILEERRDRAAVGVLAASPAGQPRRGEPLAQIFDDYQYTINSGVQTVTPLYPILLPIMSGPGPAIGT